MHARIRTLVGRLKDLPIDSSDDQQIALYALVCGALYSLARAEQLGYPGQAEGPGHAWFRLDEMKTFMTRMLVEGHPLHAGPWLAELYFTHAIFRADVAMERILRAVSHLGRTMAASDPGTPSSQEAFPSELLPIWSARARAVSEHGPWLRGELLDNPGLSFTDALAVMENLVCALEWLVRGRARDPG